MMLLARIAAIPLAAAALARAVYIVVSVGNNGQTGNLVFTPRVIYAQVGDVVSFTFQPNDVGGTGNHSIVQTSGANPCHPLTKGFVSPLSRTPGSSFNIVVYDDTVPIYFACGSTSADHPDDHCQDGEVGIINPLPGDTTDVNDAADFVRAAEAAPHDGAMMNIPPQGSGYGTGVSAYVLGYFHPQEQYSLPPGIYPSAGTGSGAHTSNGGYDPLPGWIPTPSPISGSTSSSSGTHLSTGAIAGIAVGSALIALLAILGVLRAISIKKRKDKTGMFARRVSKVLESPKEIQDVDAAMREHVGEKKVLGVQPNIEV